MISSSVTGSRKRIAVFGGAGYTGRFVVAELRRHGWPVVLSGRDVLKLRSVAPEDPSVEVMGASVEDQASLDRALDGTAAVINCAGPFAHTASPIVEAALRGRIHYLDVAAEQQATLDTFEQFDEPAKRAGIVIAPALAFYGGLGDLLAIAASADWSSVDEICVGIALDSWKPTAGTRSTAKLVGGGRRFLRQNKLVPVGDPPPMRTWDFPEPFGTESVVGIAFAEIIVIPRSLPVPDVSTYINLAPLNDVRNPATPPPVAADESGRSSQTFVLDVRVRRGNAERRAAAAGRDIYAITGTIIAEAAERIVTGRATATGALSAGQLFDARDFLEALSRREPSFQLKELPSVHGR